MLARTLWGMRLSLGIGISAAVSAGIIGIFLGLIQGYFSGFVDELIGRVNDTLLAFPGLILGLGVAAFVGEGYAVAAIAACLINAPLIARIARAASIVEADKDYVAVVRAMGLPVWRILLFHLLPNILPIAMVQVTLTMAQAMILEAALSFLGLGIQPPSPSLGNLLRDAQSYVDYAIWLPIIPGIVLSLTLILLTHIADAIAEAFDPKRRSR
jgi:peptide/nickel transport system permease protein